MSVNIQNYKKKNQSVHARSNKNLIKLSIYSYKRSLNFKCLISHSNKISKRGHSAFFAHKPRVLHSVNATPQVRWGDKHGGYGEHYWDYNHHGHGDGDGEESQHNSEYANYEDESKVDPILSSLDTAHRGKRQPSVPQDVEFINDRAKSLILDGRAQKHGGNYRRANDFRGKREQRKKFGESLIFDPDQKVVVDQETGRRYELNPVA